MASQALAKIPILDLSDDALTPGTASRLSACREVCHALEEYGCFVAAYSNLSLELHNQILEASKELFHLPTETKMQDPTRTEYVGQKPQFPLYERLGIVNATSWEEIQKFTNLMWPNGNDLFGYIYNH
jgi:isopenicillin N synthase-like dioxygenase